MSLILPSSLITETITPFENILPGKCYPGYLEGCHCVSEAITITHELISFNNKQLNTTSAITLPMTRHSLQWLNEIADEIAQASLPVNFAINYHQLNEERNRLHKLALTHSLWLYDFAEPGTDWDAVKNVPFAGVVINHPFFTDNYRKFSFPYLLQHFREQQAEVIIRCRELPLNVEECAALNLTGWQCQITDTLFIE